MKLFTAVLLLFICSSVYAQHSFSCFVKDEETKSPLANVSATILIKNIGTSSNQNGRIYFKNLPTGEIEIAFSHIGYKTTQQKFYLPQGDTIAVIFLQKETDKTEEEIIVTSSRNNSRIEDLPTKVEVLGSEEVGEENGIKPGNIASLLGDVAGIQIQQSNAATGNADARVQGLPGKYTQLLKDGMPLFGGYAGSFSILQLPPADLKQIEIIKGASSTLYGGGAIAGIINLVSKSPKLNEAENSITLNQSSLKESNINLYSSNRKNKIGYTFFTGSTYQRAVDVNKDGFSDVPDLNTLFFHPRLFIYPNAKQHIAIGYNFTYENRNGGDMQVLHDKANSQHQFFIKNKSLRNSVDVSWENKINNTSRLNAKATVSFFNRDISTNVFSMGGKQTSYYSEFAYNKTSKKHNTVLGVNINGESFNKKQTAPSGIDDYKQITTGIFVQDDWKLHSKFTIQTGVREDYNNYYGSFFLPRISMLYKITPYLTTRLGGGMGYKTPQQLSNEIDERDYSKIIHVDLRNGLTAEKSKGINWDINFSKKINGWKITANQMFYITQIDKPVVFTYNSFPVSYYPYNATQPLLTKGFETYIAAVKDELEIYFGYTYTDAKQKYNKLYPHVSLSAKNKFATVLAYEFADNMRAGIEASYTGKQYVDDGTTTKPYLFAAAMFRYDLKNISFVLNCENLFDYRQTKKENIVIAPTTNPTFKQIWAPLDGRVVNLSAKINF